MTATSTISSSPAQTARDTATRRLVDFIHVGLPKCGSTYLQAVWGSDDSYIRQNPAGLVNICREMARSGVTRSVNLGSLRPMAGKTRIVSSEGFTWCALNQPDQQTDIKALQTVSAQVLGEAGISDKVLVVVRNPVDWLRSCHDQSLKQGGCDSFAEFLATQRELCRSVLDLRHILDAFQQYFRDVVVLTAEEMRETPQDFWAKYSESLSVPEPSASEGNGSQRRHNNRRLGDRAQLLAHLNLFAKALGETYLGMTEYLNAATPSEVEKMKPTATGVLTWMNRRVVEFGTDEALAAIIEQLKIDDDDNFQRVFVDRDLHDWVETRFLAPLADIPTIAQPLIDRYRRSLAEALDEG